MAGPEGRRFLSELRGLESFGQLRDDLEGVSHDAVVRRLEEGGLGVLVDHHDHLGAIDPREVLDSPGDAHGDVEVRTNGNAGLPHMLVVRAPSDVGHRAGAGGGGADGVGEVFDDAPVLGALQATACSRHHEFGLGQRRPVATAGLSGFEDLHLGGTQVGVESLHGGGAPLGFGHADGVRGGGHHQLVGGALHAGGGLSAEDVAGVAPAVGSGGHAGDESGTEAHGHAAGHGLAEVVLGTDDEGGALLVRGSGNQLGQLSVVEVARSLQHAGHAHCAEASVSVELTGRDGHGVSDAGCEAGRFEAGLAGLSSFRLDECDVHDGVGFGIR